MRLLPRQNYRRNRWKNGGGETAEIAISPAGASLDAFDWRISMATVASSGPFSCFPEIDRTLCVLSPGSLKLDFGQNAFTLDAASEPLAFAADVPVIARLTGTAVTDLNVMTRRGRFRHHISKMQIDDKIHFVPQGAAQLIFAQNADFTAQCSASTETLTCGRTD
eukprot:gene15242-15388_t